MPLTDDHTSGVLTEVAGQTQDIPALLKIVSDASMLHIKTRRLEAVFERIAWSLPFPRAHEAGELRRRLLIETESFSNLPRSGPAAKGDDVRCHGSAQLAVTLVDVLNRTLAVGIAGQVEVDVRPLATLFRKESLKE